MELAGRARPRFTEEHGGVTVELEAAEAVATIPSATDDDGASVPESAPPADNTVAILEIIDAVGHVKTASCVQKLGISRSTAYRTLDRLVEDGILEQTGTGRGTRYRRKTSV